MIRPPKNDAEVPIWRETVSRVVRDDFSPLRQYVTADLPTLSTTDRGLAWNSTTNKPVAWNGTSWNDLY